MTLDRGEVVKVQWWSPGAGDIGTIVDRHEVLQDQWFVYIPAFGIVVYHSNNLEKLER